MTLFSFFLLKKKGAISNFFPDSLLGYCTVLYYTVLFCYRKRAKDNYYCFLFLFSFFLLFFFFPRQANAGEMNLLNRPKI